MSSSSITSGFNQVSALGQSLLDTLVKNLQTSGRLPTTIDQTVKPAEGEKGPAVDIHLDIGEPSGSLDASACTLNLAMPYSGTATPDTGNGKPTPIQGTFLVGVRLPALGLGTVMQTSFLHTGEAADSSAACGNVAPLSSAGCALEAWVRPQSDSARTVLAFGDGLSLGINAGCVVLRWGGASYTSTGLAAKLTDGAWHHVAASVDHESLTLYVDGQAKGTLKLAAPASSTGAALQMGPGFGGDITQVRVWTVARSTAQLQSMLNVHLPSNTPGLAGAWSFADGKVRNDVTGQGGSLHGGATCEAQQPDGNTFYQTSLFFFDPENTFTVAVDPPSANFSEHVEQSMMDTLLKGIATAAVTGNPNPADADDANRLPTTGFFTVMPSSKEPELLLLAMNRNTEPPLTAVPAPYPGTTALGLPEGCNTTLALDWAYMLGTVMCPEVAKALGLKTSDFQVTSNPPALTLKHSAKSSKYTEVRAFTLTPTADGVAFNLQGKESYFLFSASGMLVFSVKTQNGTTSLHVEMAHPTLNVQPDPQDPEVKDVQAMMGVPLLGMFVTLFVSIILVLMQRKEADALKQMQKRSKDRPVGDDSHAFALKQLSTNGALLMYGFTTPASGGGTAKSTKSTSAAPRIDGFSPQGGVNGTQVTLTGAGFTGTRSVMFGGTAASYFRVSSDTQLVARVGPNTSDGPIQVTTAAGTATSASSFSITPAPTLQGYNPSHARAGMQVTLTGSNLAKALSVSFADTVYASFTASGTQLVATVPEGAVAGSITVTTAGGSASLPGFIVDGGTVPSVHDFSPTGGPEGTEVTVTGSGFTGTTDVSFAGVPASWYRVLSDTQLTAGVAPRTPSGPVSVANSRGTGKSQASFQVSAPPQVTSFSPSSAPAGTSLTIHGSGLSTATSVSIGTPAAPVEFQVVDDGTLTALSPSGTASGPIRVTTPAGSAESSKSFTVRSSAPPRVDTLEPVKGGRGTAVTLTGANFTGTSAVSFAGSPAATFEVQSDSVLIAYAPKDAPSGTLQVTNTAGTTWSPQPFTYLEAPQLNALPVDHGQAGEQLVLTGKYLSNPRGVYFGASAAQAPATANADGTQLKVTIPGGARSGKIRVTTDGGSAVSTSFTVNSSQPPRVDALDTASGGVGTHVTLTGAGFTGVTKVTLNDLEAKFEPQDDTTLEVVVPKDARTGPFTVTNTKGQARSPVFTVPDAVGIDSFSPSSGQAGTHVNLKGHGFLGVRQVAFGESAMRASFTVMDDGHLTAEVPQGAISGKLQVFTEDEVAQSEQDFQVLSSQKPSVASFSPTQGSVGTQVRVNGAGFTGVTKVMLGSLAVARFQVVNDAQLEFIVPNTAKSGHVTVSNSLGDSPASQATFEVTASPQAPVAAVA